MTGPPTETIDVILAATHPHPGLAESLDRFAAEAEPLGRVVLVTPTSEKGVRYRFARQIISDRGRLVPELWRDGLIATGAPLVAFSTTQMIPRSGWLADLTSTLHESGAAGVGGPIGPGPGLSATGRAVALLRYSGYFPPPPEGRRVLPPGENALYRRDRLAEVESSWSDGFWEVEVQRALIARGHRLAMSRSAVVGFEGGTGLASMARQRFAHARRYGRFRSSGVGIGRRLLRATSAPLVPPLLIARIAGALRGRGMAPGPWVAALPALTALASAWAVGEAWGTLEIEDGCRPIAARSKERGGSPAARARARVHH